MTAIDRLHRDILSEIDDLLAAGSQSLPRRGDQVEQWLKAQRDLCIGHASTYNVVDGLLDEYRLHADTRTPLDQHCCENGTVDDCYGCHQEETKR